ncbi:hypothetical protein ABRY23_04730 [Melioribacteraceae bacterium 4301-Me]|uniref:hypothetical protein n=1 Tax=Pyranulibacter aquaticus TaxID=3163344 RepID=UPI003598A5F0
MTTLPPPAVKKFPKDSIESRVYSIAEKFKEFIPIPNDRNRLGFNLYRFVKGEGDPPEILVSSTKIKIVGISKEELAQKIREELENKEENI